MFQLNKSFVINAKISRIQNENQVPSDGNLRTNQSVLNYPES